MIKQAYIQNDSNIRMPTSEKPAQNNADRDIIKPDDNVRACSMHG